MKKIFLPLLVTAILLISGFSFGQVGSIDIGIRGNACDQLVVEWNSTYSFIGAGQNQWTQATMTITYPQALGTSVLGTITSLLPGFTGWVYSGTPVLSGGEYQQDVILSNSGYTQDIPIGVTEVIMITLNGTGTGTFTVANIGGRTNISHGLLGGLIWSGAFNPAIATDVSRDDKIVWDGIDWCGGSGTNSQPGAGDTKPCIITGLNGHLSVAGATVGSLNVQVGGELTIDPGANLTNSGNTTISQPQGFIIGADATGSGSYLDNGTINYVGAGSSKVQTYIANTAIPGNYHIHQIGPTVKNPTFGSTYAGETGVFLGEFNLMAAGTYAYRYTEPTNTWINFFQTTEPVPTACGFIFSDVSGTPSTLNMVGQLATDDGGATTFIATPSAGVTPPLSPWAVTYSASGGQGNFLASNPYPSGLDLKAMWLYYNTSNLGTVMRVWDAVAGNYATLTRKTTFPQGWLYTHAFNGTLGFINPGQAFFIETLSAWSSSFGDQFFLLSSFRGHYSGPFIKEVNEFDPGTLNIKVSNEYYYDEAYIYFAEGALPEKDYSDADKWASMYEDALEISSMSTDQVSLTVNAMPELSDMVSIPVNFKPGMTGDFTIDFSGIDSFEAGTEIFLEDLQTGGPWINLLSNPVYQFTANADDPQARFILHFFGPTGIVDPGKDAKAIQIYSYDHSAYIVNHGNEVIQEYVVYDMMGREMQRGTLPNSTVNKVFIGFVSNYYIVKVVTNTRIYSEKVFINR